MKLSENLQNLLQDYTSVPLPLGILVERTGKQGFGIISGLLTLPMLIPIPAPLAGFSTLLASGIILMGLQLALDFPKPWLPPCIAKRKLSPTLSQRLLKNLNRILRPLERLAKTRLLTISHHWFWRRFVGMCLVWNAILLGLPLPIPFTNLLPAYTILILAIGILEEDGIFILLGLGMTAATTVFFVSIAGAIWELVRLFLVQ